MGRGIWGKKLLFSHGKSNARGVAIGFCGNLDYKLTKTETDTDGRFIIVEAKINKENYVLVNFYNENDEANQLKLLEKIKKSLEKFSGMAQKDMILAGDFNLIFDLQLDADGGNPKLKKNLITKYLKSKEKYDIIDIWRMRN